jgi:hypothetical protein
MSRGQQNDRAKLILHRLVARRLKSDPPLVEHARAVLEGWKTSAEDRGWSGCIEAWDKLLGLPLPALRKAITCRTETAQRLRLSSPFAVVPDLMITDIGTRKRIWRVAKRGLERERILSAPSVRWPRCSIPTRCM